MATREENLRKIHAELEKLTDEQLEQIAGGQRMWEWQPIMSLTRNNETEAKMNPNLLVRMSKNMAIR